MKNLTYIIAIFTIFQFAATSVYSQKLSKAEKKAQKKEEKKWKKKMKSMDPLKFRDMYEEYNTMKAENGALRRNVERAQNAASEKESALATIEQQIIETQQKLQDVQADCGKSPAGGEDFTKGIVYKVQIGNFRNKDLSKYLKKGSFWSQDEDGTKKYTIKFFRDYWEADTFKKYLREMGLKDAWIVAYENNQRKDIKDVLQGAPPNAGN